eukprot:TRINITY_DN25393_c0_g1_i1.p1 TRINITY_DN25393_c0_g1~~TRINITY_DN25393_c0_g1_i1.p1  ORF type:complete len:302 (+),score=50.50 TRINITY_DN25393_c0_g1_i1:33-908(+)
MADNCVALEYNSHFINPTPPEKQIWELSYENRRRIAKDPRIQKQLQDDEQFEGMNIENIWCKLKEHTGDNREMTHADFGQFLRLNQLTSDHLIRKLTKIFDKDNNGTINSILLCRYLHIIVNDPAEPLFCETAFECYDRPPLEDEISTNYFTSVLKLQDPNSQPTKKSKKKQSDNTQVERQGDVTYAIQEASRKCLKLYPRPDPTSVSVADFRRWWQRDAELVAAFTRTIFEVIASVYSSKELPKLPNSFFKSLQPVSEQPFCDADWWLLKEYEKRGINPITESKKKGKKK